MVQHRAARYFLNIGRCTPNAAVDGAHDRKMLEVSINILVPLYKYGFSKIEQTKYFAGKIKKKYQMLELEF